MGWIGTKENCIAKIHYFSIKSKLHNKSLHLIYALKGNMVCGLLCLLLVFGNNCCFGNNTTASVGLVAALLSLETFAEGSNVQNTYFLQLGFLKTKKPVPNDPIHVLIWDFQQKLMVFYSHHLVRRIETLFQQRKKDLALKIKQIHGRVGNASTMILTFQPKSEHGVKFQS